ncbi:MAG: hypothetical protein IJ364_02695 [Oscillospiraceae bacterium]|nr:hypothetical protein [Oscillospiraceae bacterium]
MTKKLLPDGCITVKEYNQKYHTEIRHAESFLACLEHAMQKSGAYEEAMRQLSVIGWPECKETIHTALEVYRQVVLGKVEGRPRSEFRCVVLCEECGRRGTKGCQMTWEENEELIDWAEDGGFCDRGERKVV